MTPVHLFTAGGRFVAWYRPGMPYVWSVRNRWVGWFAWPGHPDLGRDVLDPSGEYLGTVVGDRLLQRLNRSAVPLPVRAAEPQRPVGAPDVADAVLLPLPPGYAEVPGDALR